MKRILIVLILVPLLTLGAAAADKDSIIQEQMEKSGASSLYQKAPDDVKKSLNQLGVENPSTNSLSKFTPAGLFKIILSKARTAAEKPIKAVVTVFGILLACALVNTMKNSFGEKPLKNVFDLVCTLCIATAIMVPVSQCISSAAAVVKQSSTFLLSFLPVFVGLVSASGHPASAVMFQSFILVAAQIISEIAATTFVPMVSLYLAFCVIGSISPGINISGISGFVKKAVSYGLVLCMTVFTGILTVQGLISQAADNVTMKTAKFVVGNAIPVIGSTISDAMNTVVGCANLLKTATGAYAIIIFILAFLPPILECLLWMLAVDLSLAIADILDIVHISGLLKSVKEALSLLIALVLAAALTMIISISIMLLLGMGN